jgi:ribosomal protein S6
MAVSNGVSAEEAAAAVETGADEGVGASRIYEVGYVLTPSLKEDELERVVGGVRKVAEKHGGNFIAEGAPTMTRLAYAMESREGGKRFSHDRGYFGWLKFEADAAVAKALEAFLKEEKNVVRSVVFRTVREDTRAKFKAPTLREVKRTDTIKSTPRRAEAAAGTVSEEDLEKALQDITAD